MDWLERLNRSLGRVSLGQGTVEVLSWAYARHLTDNKPHRHTFFEVCLVGDYGQGKFIVQDREHALHPGDIFVARPGVVHQIVNAQEPGMELYWVSFQWTAASGSHLDEADQLLRAFAEASTLVVPDEAGRLHSLWQALRTVADGPLSRGYDIQYHALATALLLGIAQSASDSEMPPALELPGMESGDRAARLAVRFIHDNLNRPLTLPEIAAQGHLSPRHLSRVFARFTGTSPASYIQHARMDRAQGLLRHSDRAIKAIAAEVGYPDVHHFTRVFTRHFGCPPAVYRRAENGYVPNIQNPGDLV